jgi:UDP-glucose 4-epimerase
VNRLVELLGGTVIFVPKRPGEPDCTFGDTAKIHKLLGWHPRVSFEDGVAKMLDCIEDWREAPVWDSVGIQEATAAWFRYLKDD